MRIYCHYIYFQDWIPFPVTLFGPVIEGNTKGAFLTETPNQFYAQARRNVEKKRWIFSMTSEEGFLALLCKF